jgi:hypothetical protein
MRTGMIRKYDPIGKFHYVEEGEVELTPSQRLEMFKDDLPLTKFLAFFIGVAPSIYSIPMIVKQGYWGYLITQIGIALFFYILSLWIKYRIRKIEKYLIVRDVMDN